MIQFTVPGVPVAQPRQRHRIWKTKAGKTFAQNYTPARDPVNEYKAAVRAAASAAHSHAPLAGAIVLEAVFLFPRTKAMIWKNRPMPRAPKTGRPDTDNLEKSLKDALTGILFTDDAQVTDVVIKKRYAAGDEQAATIVVVRELEITGNWRPT